jgi:putative nucleotidyltransferase with HDIG domain
MRIIFVDDEIRVLDGIRRLLYLMRPEWEMSFACGGERALEIMAATPHDVVISDIRMPGMDGTELLFRISVRHPEVIRIALSGQSERDLTLKAAVCAHQYLSKPCDADSLKHTISRAFALKSTLTDASLQAVVAGAGNLPSVPSAFQDLMNRLQDSEFSAIEIGAIIGRDPAMCAKVLQLSNSAFFGVRRRITSISDAVASLGLDTLKTLALDVGVFSTFSANTHSSFSIERFGHHAVLTAALSRKIAQAEGLPSEETEDAFVAGLLHDIGRLVMISAMPEKYNSAVILSKLERISTFDAEKRTYGTTHSEVGAYLLWLWGLPDNIVQAVAHHHSPAEYAGARSSTLLAVHIADALIHEPDARAGIISTERLDRGYIRSLGLAERIAAWRDLIDTAERRSKVA